MLLILHDMWQIFNRILYFADDFYNNWSTIVLKSTYLKWVIVLYIIASVLHLLVRLIMKICITPFLLPVYSLTSSLSGLILYDYESMIWVPPVWVPGSIPSWLQGTLLRNGPGLFSVGNSNYNHWFDGLSLIHSFTFTNGKILHTRTWGKVCRETLEFVAEYIVMVTKAKVKNSFSLQPFRCAFVNL